MAYTEDLHIPGFGPVPASAVEENRDLFRNVLPDGAGGYSGFNPKGGEAAFYSSPEDQSPPLVAPAPEYTVHTGPAPTVEPAQPILQPQSAPQEAPTALASQLSPDQEAILQNSLTSRAKQVISTNKPGAEIRNSAKLKAEAALVENQYQNDAAKLNDQYLASTQQIQKDAYDQLDKLYAEENAKLENFQALREQSRQKRYEIDPNKNRFQEGSNTAVALLGGFLEGFVRPGQPSQISKTVSELVDEDVKGQLRLMDREDKNVDLLNDEERATLNIYKGREAQEKALRVLKLDRIKTEMDIGLSKMQGTANYVNGLKTLAGVVDAQRKAENELAQVQAQQTSAAANMLHARTAEKQFNTDTAFRVAKDIEERISRPLTNAQAGIAPSTPPEARKDILAARELDVKLAGEQAKYKADAAKNALPSIPGLDSQGKSGTGARAVAVNESAGNEFRKLDSGAKAYLKAMDTTKKLMDEYAHSPSRFVPGTEAHNKLVAAYAATENAYRKYTGTGANYTEIEAKNFIKSLGSPQAIFNVTAGLEQTRDMIINERVQEGQAYIANYDPDAYRGSLERAAGVNAFSNLTPNDVAREGNRTLLVLSQAATLQPGTIETELNNVSDLLKSNSSLVNTPQLKNTYTQALYQLQQKGVDKTVVASLKKELDANYNKAVSKEQEEANQEGPALSPASFKSKYLPSK